MPRYFVEHYLGEAALGYFAALAYITVAGNTVTAALGQSAAPRLARYYISDRRAFVRLLLKMVLLAASLGAGGVVVAVVAGRPLLTLIYRADYAQHAHVLTWLMVAGAISYVASMLGYGMTAARKFRVQVPLNVGVTGVTALACWLLVPRFGLQGAAYALLATAITSCASKAWVTSVALRSQTHPSQG